VLMLLVVVLSMIVRLLDRRLLYMQLSAGVKGIL